jgi:polyisoprenoid-binding protein YceI
VRVVFPELVIVLVASIAAPARAEQHAIDTRKSVMTVHVSSAGVFGAFGHDHDITAPITSGRAEVSPRPSVELRVDARALRVSGEKESEKDRAKVQATMLGPEVLDSDRHPEIVFRSTAVEPSGSGGWRVQGNLTLHGQTRPVSVEVSEKQGRYVGSARFKQSEFGIKPVKVAGGAVKVKDEVRIAFDIQLAR